MKRNKTTTAARVAADEHQEVPFLQLSPIEKLRRLAEIAPADMKEAARELLAEAEAREAGR